jgi:DNA-binding IclR family transcriptional regulator
MVIQSVSRALKILKLFSTGRPRLGTTEISQLLGLHKATAQGLVRTLKEEGFLKQDPETKKYQLGLSIYELGVALASGLEINQRAVDPAHQLALETQFVVRVSIFDKDSAIIILDAYPRSTPFLYPQFGLRFPLYCTAMGKALLAFLEPDVIRTYCEKTEFTPFTKNTITQKDQLARELEEIRKTGYSINREEHLQARAAIGAPIFGRDGRITASISIVGEPVRILGDDKERFAQKVVGTASQISQALGYFPRPRPELGRERDRMSN